MNEFGCTPKQKKTDKAREFQNKSIRSQLQNNDIEIYSANNKGKFVVAAVFIRTLKNKICKYMTSVSENVYIDQGFIQAVLLMSIFWSKIELQVKDSRCCKFCNGFIAELWWGFMGSSPKNNLNLKGK